MATPEKTNGNLAPKAEQLRKELSHQIKSQPYTAEISRQTPAAFVFLLDRSNSMNAETQFRGQGTTLAQAVADVMNLLFQELLLACTRKGGVGDYVELLLISYGDEEGEQARIDWMGPLAGREWVPVSELQNAWQREEERSVEKKTRGGTKTELQKMPIWVEPRAGGKTPLLKALSLASDHLSDWIKQHPENFPPSVFNITDGKPDGTEAQLLNASKEVRDLYTQDGNVLFYNIHITPDSSNQILFPAALEELPDDGFAQQLYRMSSTFPKAFYPRLADIMPGRDPENAVAMAYNAEVKSLWQLLEIGTRTSGK